MTRKPITAGSSHYRLHLVQDLPDDRHKIRTETDPALNSSKGQVSCFLRSLCKPHNLNLIASVETAWRRWNRNLFLSAEVRLLDASNCLSHCRIRHLSLSLPLPLSPSLPPSIPPTSTCSPPGCVRRSVPSARPPPRWHVRSFLCAPCATWLPRRNLDQIEWICPPRSPFLMPNPRDGEPIVLLVP